MHANVDYEQNDEDVYYTSSLNQAQDAEEDYSISLLAASKQSNRQHTGGSN